MYSRLTFSKWALTATISSGVAQQGLSIHRGEVVNTTAWPIVSLSAAPQNAPNALVEHITPEAWKITNLTSATTHVSS